MLLTDASDCRVVLLTTNHWIEGTVTLRDQRLSDFMNSPLESTVLLQGVTVARLSDPRQVLGHASGAVLPKSQIVAALEARFSTAVSVHRVYRYVPKSTAPVWVALDGLEIEGLVHTSGDLDLRRLVPPVMDKFLPITQAKVRVGTTAYCLVEAETVLINAQHVHALLETPFSEASDSQLKLKVPEVGSLAPLERVSEERQGTSIPAPAFSEREAVVVKEY